MMDYLDHRTEIAGLCDPAFYPVAWIDKQVWSGAIRTLSNATSIIGFEIKTYPGGAREIHGMFAAGDLEGILPLIDEAEEVGRGLGCSVATIASREGWAKVLKSRGYGPHQVTLKKELR
jgi:hypothetical protein